MLRQVQKGLRVLQSQRRLASDYISSEPHHSIPEVAVVKLQRPPVNSLDLEFLRAIPEKILELEKDESVRGFILTSTNEKVFSAGLDIPFLMGKDREFLLEFGDALQGLWTGIYGTTLATVAAINGHALAGGCLITSACDYRVSLDTAQIGLPEVHLGIVAPVYLREMIATLMGRRQAEWALITGHAMPAHLAQQLGLTDEVKESKEEVTQRCEEMIGALLKLNEQGRVATKLEMRRPLVVMANALRKESREAFAANGSDPKVQESIRKYFEQLKKK